MSAFLTNIRPGDLFRIVVYGDIEASADMPIRLMLCMTPEKCIYLCEDELITIESPGTIRNTYEIISPTRAY